MNNEINVEKGNIIPKEKDKFGGYISRLVLNNNTEITINESDIVVFVGPNNVGKSQSLKDIYQLCEGEKTSIVIKDIEIVKRKGDIFKLLDSISTVNDYGSYKGYSGFRFSVSSYDISGYNSEQYYKNTRSLFVTYLDTLNRLTISNPAPLITRKDTKNHPIHYAAFEQNFRKWLSDNFEEAFGKKLIPYILNGGNIPLCIGNAVNFNKEEFADEQERQEEYAKVLDTYEQVQNQGDGIKSFTGILLYLMIDHYCTYLIDEPESFLHPPQANIMGRIIGKTLRINQQAFISTHSEEIIKGLLDVCPERVKIIRVTRDDNDNKFSVLANERVSSVWNDPLLKYSNIMTSLFHKEVILCESDSDCKMYSVIDNRIKQSQGRYSETLFIHCGGKHRMAKIAKSLRSLDVCVKLIPDMDVLNDENVFKEILEAFNIEWDSVKKSYNMIVSNLHSPKERIYKNDVKACIEKICKQTNKEYLSNNEIKEIKTSISTISKWDEIKKRGVSALSAGDSTQEYKKMDSVLKKEGIFIVPVGELECFIKDVGGHGPEWTNTVLEKFPDLDDDVYKEIKDFVKMVCQ